jgi:hypothetical protein
MDDAPTSAPVSTPRDVESASSGGSPSSGPTPPYFKLVTTATFIMNLGLMFFQAAVGAIGIGESNSINDTGLIFVGLYVFLFASLVFIFELIQVCKWSAADNFYKRNFGFLYGINGKGMFLLL